MLKWTKATKVSPDYAAGSQFVRSVPLPQGVVKEVQIDFRGTLVGPPAAVFLEGLANLIDKLKITFPTVSGRDYILEGQGRDLIKYAEFITGRRGRKTQPAGATASLIRFTIPLGVPGRFAGHRWGIDSRELSGQVVVTGQYGAAANYGTGTTGLTNGELSVSFGVSREPEAPRLVLLPVENRIAIDSATKVDQELAHGDLDGLLGCMLRTFDASAAGTADRPDGLVSEVTFKHSRDGIITEDQFLAIQEKGAAFSRLANAELTAAAPDGFTGLAFDIWNPELLLSRYVPVGGPRVSVKLDGQNAPPTGVTNVVPAAGDQVIAYLMGVQANSIFAEMAAQGR